MIRLIFVLRRKPEMSLAEYQQYWRETHGPLVAKHATALNIHRYIQLHTLDDPVNDQLAGDRGSMEPSYDGVACLAALYWACGSVVQSGGSAKDRRHTRRPARDGIGGRG